MDLGAFSEIRVGDKVAETRMDSKEEIKDSGKSANGLLFFHSGPDGTPKSMISHCLSVQFKTKDELLHAPLEQRYQCSEKKFSRPERNYLKDKGFYLRNISPAEMANIQFDDMVDLYNKYTFSERPDEIYEVANEFDSFNLVPLFITADYMLHSYHLIFSRMLEEIEEKKFYPILRELTRDLLAQALIKYRDTKDGVLKGIYKNIVLFFAVPAKVMDLEVNTEEINAALSEIIKGMNANQGFQNLTITGQKEDFSQYKPRGHYAKSDVLRKYFKAMMWYGRINFPVKMVENIAISLMLLEPNNLRRWEAIYHATAFIVGKSDDLDIYDYRKAIDEIFGSDFKLSKIPEAGQMQRLSGFMKKINKSKIVSTSTRTPDGKFFPRESLKGFRFMGQRFIPDSYIFTELTSPRVGSAQKPRNMPQGLDVFAILGAKEAEKILSESNRNVKGFNEKFLKLKTEFAAFDEKTYQQNIYWSWLDSFRALFMVPQGGLPRFVYTPEWQYRLLLTSHGSWAELRHDTLLYAKQSYAEMGGEGEVVYYAGQPDYPKGYIEPNIAFFEKLNFLVKETREKLLQANVLTDEYRQKLAQFKEIVERLRQILHVQLSGQKISYPDFIYLANFSKTLKWLVLPGGTETMVDEEEKKMAIVADVHTDALGGQVLEVGIGIPKEINILVDDINGRRVLTGFVYSYYEFAQPMSDRLTDEIWRKEVWDKVDQKKLRQKEPLWLKKLPIIGD
jgi:hypothetical protein